MFILTKVVLLTNYSTIKEKDLAVVTEDAVSPSKGINDFANILIDDNEIAKTGVTP